MAHIISDELRKLAGISSDLSLLFLWAGVELDPAIKDKYPPVHVEEVKRFLALATPEVLHDVRANGSLAAFFSRSLRSAGFLPENASTIDDLLAALSDLKQQLEDPYRQEEEGRRKLIMLMAVMSLHACKKEQM